MKLKYVVSFLTDIFTIFFFFFYFPKDLIMCLDMRNSALSNVEAM